MLAIILGARRGQRPGLVDFLPRHPKNFASSLAGQDQKPDNRAILVKAQGSPPDGAELGVVFGRRRLDCGGWRHGNQVLLDGEGEKRFEARQASICTDRRRAFGDPVDKLSNVLLAELAQAPAAPCGENLDRENALGFPEGAFAGPGARVFQILRRNLFNLVFNRRCRAIFGRANATGQRR